MKPNASIHQLLVIGNGEPVKAVLIEYDETRHRARKRCMVMKNEEPEPKPAVQAISLFLEDGICVCFDPVLAATLTARELPGSIHATVAKALDLPVSA